MLINGKSCGGYRIRTCVPASETKFRVSRLKPLGPTLHIRLSFRINFSDSQSKVKTYLCSLRAWRELNPQPLDPQSNALSIKLQAQKINELLPTVVLYFIYTDLSITQTFSQEENF